MPPIFRPATAILLLALLSLTATAQDSPFTKVDPNEKPTLDKPYGNVYVLAIGVNTYARNTTLSDLNFAQNDAATVADVFKDRFRYNTTTLVNEKATRENIYKEIDRIAGSMGQDDAFIFYFAGHGMTHTRVGKSGAAGNTGLIIPHIQENLRDITIEQVSPELKEKSPFAEPEKQEQESDEDHQDRIKLKRIEWEKQLIREEASRRLPGLAIDMISLRDHLLTHVPGKHKVLLFDSCFSGFATVSHRAMLNPGELDDFSKQFSRWNRLRPPSAYAITAGSSSQKVIEHTGNSRGFNELVLNKAPDEPIRHGVFTYELISVLESIDKGDALSVNQLWMAIDDRVGTTLAKMGTGYEMHPQVRDLTSGGGSGEFVFVADPVDQWLGKIIAGLGSENMEPSELDRTVTRSAEEAEKADHAALDQEKLESEAMLVYISRKAQRIKMGETTDLSKDGPMVQRYETTRRRAASGDEAAMATLAYMHAYGLGTAQDRAQAGTWAAEARGEGNAHASVVLSEMLERGFQNELNIEGIQQIDKLMLQQNAQQTQAVGGVALLLAAQASDDPGTRGLGMLMSFGVLADSFFKKAPTLSYEATLAAIDQNMRKLESFAEDINDHETRKPSNKFEQITTTIETQINSLNNSGLKDYRVKNFHREFRYPRRFMAWEAANDLKELVRELREPKTRGEIDNYLSQLEEMGMPYARMIALSDYIAGQREWTHD